jgi:hypothetical protein
MSKKVRFCIAFLSVLGVLLMLCIGVVIYDRNVKSQPDYSTSGDKINASFILDE